MPPVKRAARNETQKELEEIRKSLGHLHELSHKQNERIIEMSAALDRLNASAAAQTAAINENTAAVDALIAAGTGSTPGDSQEALNAVADTVDANTAATQANTAKLAAALPPTP